MDISIEQLKRDWDKMRPLDRARAVDKIKKSGTSTRSIARQIGKSDGLLRHLLLALKAPAYDRALAYQGKITTNELARRATAAQAVEAEKLRQAEKLKRTDAAVKAANTICTWLEGTGLNGTSCEVIIEQVRSEIAERELNGTLPPRPKQINRTVDEIIQLCKPPDPDDSIIIDGWYTGWLCNWVFLAFPDSDIRSTALEIALQRQWKR